MKILLLIMMLAITACSDKDGAYEAIENMGMSNIRITGYTFWGCDDKDVFHTGFIATNAQGKEVRGVVCSGWFKGSTVRFK